MASPFTQIDLLCKADGVSHKFPFAIKRKAGLEPPLPGHSIYRCLHSEHDENMQSALKDIPFSYHFEPIPDKSWKKKSYKSSRNDLINNH